MSLQEEEDRIARHFSKQKTTSASKPRFGSGAAKCPRCSKSVYAAERVFAIGKEVEITLKNLKCLKCPECNKRLDSTTLTEHEGSVYCKACYAKRFGPTGFGNVATTHTERAGDTHKTPVNASPHSDTSNNVDNNESAVNSGALHHVEADSGVGSAPKFCPECGSKNGNATAKFCGECGNKF